MIKTIGRHDPCPCGSGKKYKQCCLLKAPRRTLVHPRLLQDAYSFYKAERLDEAGALYQRILQIDPDNAEALHVRGLIADAQGQGDVALALIRRAVKIDPDTPHFHGSLGNVLRARYRLAEAIDCYRQALELKPDLAEAHNNLGSALKDLGQYDEAVESFRLALFHSRACAPVVYNNLLFLYGFRNLLYPERYLEQARDWERICVPDEDLQVARQRVFERAPLSGRRLRIGYVSGDFREHPVRYFVEQLFEHHDRSRVEVYAYSTLRHVDAVTERLRERVDRWMAATPRDSDDALRDQIDDDGIDVLIDLSGHTVHNRLGVFARRAAPVQAHYLGFFASTGLTEMDYWIGDEVMTPAVTDLYFSERVWRLPRASVSYAGRADAPPSNWRGAEDGNIRIGTFNNLIKITTQTIALWARILRALPEAVLLLKTRSLADSGNRHRILAAFAEHDIGADRIELDDAAETTEWAEHMAHYDRLDIALDPIGSWGGNTTTCDALWMGVPVITLLGDRACTRMTAAMLNALGHPEWIAQSEVDYVALTVRLARDVALRRQLRAEQRARMRQSPLCDARSLARALEEAYCAMFEQWQTRQLRRTH